jgi:hypothetical protein
LAGAAPCVIAVTTGAEGESRRLKAAIAATIGCGRLV